MPTQTKEGMFNLGQYLHQLLLIHPQVGVPGIGVFTKARIAARYDEQLEKFLPPTSSYSLIPHATTDNYLVDYVAKSMHLSNEEAIDVVDKTVNRLLTDIDELGEAKLEPIGYLKQMDGTYTLVSKELQSFWGLQPVDDYKEESLPEELPAVQEQPDTILQEPAIPTEPEQPEISYETVANQRETNNNVWLWVVTGIIAIGLAAFLFWKRQEPGIPPHQNEINVALKDTTNGSANTAKDTSTNLPDTTTTGLPADSLADSLNQRVSKEEKEPLVRKASKEKPFSIVIGSFKTMKLAIEQAKYFRTIGINAFVLESNMPNNRKKICYGSYPTKEAAKEQLEKVRNEITKEAYIYP